MSVSKLSLYNNALLLVGERALSTETDEIPSRYELDTAYENPSAADFCLELVKPKFALKTVKLSNPDASTEHGLTHQYSFPPDYITFHRSFSDNELDEQMHRYIIEDRTISCDVDSNIWLRYITNSREMSNWTPSFANVVSAYLAKQIAPRLAPQKILDLEQLFVSRVEAAMTLEGVKEEQARPSAKSTTLSTKWRSVYNQAFFILGLDEITTNNDDSNRRAKADVAIGNGLVETVLEDVGWTFALTSDKLTYDPSLEPLWGFKRVFEKPIKMHRIYAMWADDYGMTPLEYYQDEGDHWYCDYDEIFIQYVSTDFLNNPSDWPQYFTNMVAATLAVQLAPPLKPEMLEYAELKLHNIERASMSADAMRSPPQKISAGSWSRSRGSFRRGSYNQRP